MGWVSTQVEMDPSYECPQLSWLLCLTPTHPLLLYSVNKASIIFWHQHIKLNRLIQKQTVPALLKKPRIPQFRKSCLTEGGRSVSVWNYFERRTAVFSWSCTLLNILSVLLLNLSSKTQRRPGDSPPSHNKNQPVVFPEKEWKDPTRALHKLWRITMALAALLQWNQLDAAAWKGGIHSDGIQFL